MSQADHISQDDLILLAMQFLPEKEQADALTHIDACTECREEFARIQGDLAMYALTVDMHSPPAYTRERLMRKVAREAELNRDLAGNTTPAPGFFGLRPWLGWAIAASLAVISIGQLVERLHAGSSYQAQLTQMETHTARAQEVLETMTDTRALQVGLHMASPPQGAQGKAPEAHAAYMASTGALVFFASNLQPLQAYKTYELWLIPANGREPIAAGVFKPDASGNANVLMPNLPKGVSAAGFGVTIEDEGGAKQPTPPILMQGS